MKKTSLLGMVEKKPAQLAPVEAPPVARAEPQSVADDERVRVVVRLNLEAVEALEDITKQLRRETGKAIPLQRLMEEAVADVLRKYGRSAVVLPAPAKRGR